MSGPRRVEHDLLHQMGLPEKGISARKSQAARRVGAPVEEHIHPCISLILKLGFKAEKLGTRTEVEVVVVVVQARRSQPGKCSHVMSRLSACS